jgi:hypothetical protein
MIDTRPVTPEEYEIFGSFMLEKGIATDGQVGQDNGVKFGNYLADRNQRITKENLDLAYVTIKNQLVHLDPVSAEYNRLAVYFTAPERDAIASFMNQQGLDVQDHLLSNWNIFAKFLIDWSSQPEFAGKAYSGKALAATPENLRFALTRIPSSRFQWKQQQSQGRKFDAEAAVKAQKDTPKVQRDESQVTQRSGDHPDSWVRPLDGHLKAWRDSNHRAAEKVEPERTDPEQFYKAKAEALVNAIQSNVDREEIGQILKNGPGWGWQLTLRTIEHRIAQRKYERSVAGR